MVPPHLAPIVSANGLHFLSGQLAFDSAGAVSGDVAHQTWICLERLEAELKTVGRDRNAIVKTTVWLTETAHFAAFNAAYAKFFGEHKPARATVIAGLAISTALVEIEAIATT